VVNWSLESRDGEWCVVDASGDAVGVHSSRADAIKHQRALYAQEARVASMYAELDALPDPPTELQVDPKLVVDTSSGPSMSPGTSALSPLASELVGLLLRDEREKSLVASMADSQAQLVRQQAEQSEERHALVAALTRLGQPVIHMPEPVVNINVPETQVSVNVPAAEVNVTVPDIHVNVPAPNVTVRPEITLASTQKTVTFERDPLTQQVVKAEVTEG
jgi:hypothetical protein